MEQHHDYYVVFVTPEYTLLCPPPHPPHATVGEVRTRPLERLINWWCSLRTHFPVLCVAFCVYTLHLYVFLRALRISMCLPNKTHGLKGKVSILAKRINMLRVCGRCLRMWVDLLPLYGKLLGGPGEVQGSCRGGGSSSLRFIFSSERGSTAGQQATSRTISFLLFANSPTPKHAHTHTHAHFLTPTLSVQVCCYSIALFSVWTVYRPIRWQINIVLRL